MMRHGRCGLGAKALGRIGMTMRGSTAGALEDEEVECEGYCGSGLKDIAAQKE